MRARVACHSLPYSKITFAGPLATKKAQERLLSRDQFIRALAKEPHDTTVGELPKAWLKAVGLDDRHAKKQLDELALILRSSWVVDSLTREESIRIVNESLTVPLPPGAKIIFLGERTFGKSFAVQVGEATLCLKVFKPMLGIYGLREDQRETQQDFLPTSDTVKAFSKDGPYKEAANGLFLTARNVTNVVPFYAAHPLKGWLAKAYLDDDQQFYNSLVFHTGQMLGPTYQDLGLQFLDDDLDNSIRHVRFDYGGLERVRRSAFRAAWTGVIGWVKSLILF
ncbi:MAG: hypothetical protein K2X01_06650 [Cyanobacteria bacterium]|nr:hypothetical protein [Cyanobacteriota bacterium]